ncbi:uncharacterized protein [Pleurodeles waltl]|uniref:uncharacterized protein isoform X1 n=1 Tax=Pleurodeles waltl TaxID=8319 RepID=UPI00370990BE
MQAPAGSSMVNLGGFLLLLLVLSCSLLAAKASDPNCSNVRDFGKCLGTTTNFCPASIECACKDQKPFCKCPNYRESLTDYWYMGPKCEHLWNTLDLILVIVFPAVALASVASVTVQWIYYCKNRPKNYRKHASSRQMAGNEISLPKVNPAYIPEEHIKDDFTLSYLPKQRTAPDVAETERSRMPRSVSHANDQRYPHQEAIFPHVTRKPNTSYNAYSQNQRFSYEDSVLPGQDYVERTPKHPMIPVATIPRPKFNVPELPCEDYELNPYPSNDHVQLSSKPYVMGRPQVKNHYDY